MQYGVNCSTRRPFESAKAISGAINVLNNYPTVTSLDNEKFWLMMWQYAASHTPTWKVYAKSTGGGPVSKYGNPTTRMGSFEMGNEATHP